MSFRLRGGQPFQKRKPQPSRKSCGKSIKVARVRITEAGRRALRGNSEHKCRARILDKARERLRVSRTLEPFCLRPCRFKDEPQNHRGDSKRNRAEAKLTQQTGNERPVGRMVIIDFADQLADDHASDKSS